MRRNWSPLVGADCYHCHFGRTDTQHLFNIHLIIELIDIGQSWNPLRIGCFRHIQLRIDVRTGNSGKHVISVADAKYDAILSTDPVDAPSVKGPKQSVGMHS